MQIGLRGSFALGLIVAASWVSPVLAAQDRDAQVKLLTDAIADPEAGSSDEKILEKTAVGLRASDPRLCSGHDSAAVADCLARNLKTILTYANKKHALDDVEFAVLKHKTSWISGFANNTFSFDRAREAEPGGKGVPLPSSSVVYRHNKAEFAERRRRVRGTDDVDLLHPVHPPQMGDPALVYDKILAEVLKAYPRKVNGVGAVSAEEYFASQIGIVGLNRIADLMRQAARQIGTSSSKLVQFPANYTMNEALDQKALAARVELAQRYLDHPEDADKTIEALGQYNAVHSQLDAKMPLYDLLAKKASLTTQLNAALARLALPNVEGQPPIDRTALATEAVGLSAQLTEVETSINSQMVSRELPPPAVMNLAVNELRNGLQLLSQEDPYNRMNLQVGDVVLAAWVTGDLDTEAVHYLLSTEGLMESHPSTLSQVLGFVRAIGQNSLVLIPGVGQIAGVSLQVTLSAVGQIKGQERAGSNATQAIPVRP